ncbi:MAG TPA: hypothetical protein VJ983_00670, partial [candidate division Zixibacteria bacterium]|nr:hypothetical protein [candidate division Zixibacteria bacterium]
MRHRLIVSLVFIVISLGVQVTTAIPASYTLFKQETTCEGMKLTRAECTFSRDSVTGSSNVLKISCFDDGCSLSIKLPGDSGVVQGTIDHRGGRVTLRDGAISRHEIFTREDSCVEWLAILDRAPSSCSLSLPILTQNLVFYFQDSLSDYEKSLGAERADSVVNSWAVYRSAASNESRNVRRYGTEKAFHIYRPKVWDGSGDSCWADLRIDTVKEALTIILDSAYLKHAVYPVAIDPTFGFSAGGASSTALSTVEAWGNKNSQHFFTSDGSEQIDSLYAYLKSYSAGTYYADLALYTVESGNPSVRVGTAGTVSGSGSAVTWRGVAVDESLTAGSVYTLCIGNPFNGTRVQYDSGISGQNSRQTNSTELESSWNHTVDGTMLLSIY